MSKGPYRILIVDDSPDDREAYRRIILKALSKQYIISEADCGEEGLRLCQTEPPDCLLLDYSLPDFDGLEFLEQLRKEGSRLNVPVVFLTGHGNEAVAVQAMKLGAVDYLVKGNVTDAKLHSNLQGAIDKAVLHKKLEKQAEILRQSQAQFRLLIEQAPISIAMFDRQMNHLAHSRRWIDDFGGGKTDLIGLNHYEVYPDLPDKWKQVHREAQAGAFLKHDNDLWIHEDGSRQWVRWSAYPWTDEGGEIGGIIISAEDITAFKLFEESLRESERQNRQLAELLENSDQPFAMGYPDGRLSYVNSAYERLTGYNRGELMALDWAKTLTPPEWRGLVQTKLEELHQTGNSVRYEKEYLRKDGTRVPVELLVNLITDEAGEPPQYYAFLTDLTVKKEYEAALHEANHRKDEFLVMLGHELRNPLTPISNIAQTLGTMPLTGTAVAKASEILTRNVAHITRIVDDLLDVSRITRGLVTIDRQPLELGKLLKDTAESVQSFFTAKQQTLDFHLPAQPIDVEGDSVRLTQVFSNLLTNASKYTGEGGRIKLRVDIKNPSVIVRVMDYGMGIEPQLLPHIFDLFTQGERGLARSEGGLGIGLTLVKKLVYLHGGEVAAYSQGANQGSEFVVKLPTFVEASAETEPMQALELVRNNEQGLRILMIDDNKDVLDSISLWLEMEGHRVETAINGINGISMAQDFAPDIILLDIGMPDIDGYQVAKTISEQPHSQEMVIVAMSGYNPGQSGHDTDTTCFDHYLLKPPKLGELQNLIKRYQRQKQSDKH